MGKSFLGELKNLFATKGVLTEFLLIYYGLIKTTLLLYCMLVHQRKHTEKLGKLHSTDFTLSVVTK